MSANETIGGVIVEDLVVPAGGSWSRVIKKGQVIRIIDLEGKQAVDFLCYNADDYEDRYAAADTMKINDTGIFLSLGTVLYSVGLTPLFTIVRDTCGRHDTIGGCCSAALNTFRYRVGYQPNCRDNFLTELRKYGMGPRDLAANVNFFMYVPVGDNGRWIWDQDFQKREISLTCEPKLTFWLLYRTAHRSIIL